MDRLVEHDVTLRGGHVVLRPLTEKDWAFLVKWNNDPEVLHYAEGDSVTGRPLEEVQGIYRAVSRHAHCFVIEHGGTPIGECWLQRMNLARISEKHPGLDVRRVDIVIGEKGLWGRGLGTEAVRLLVDFGFKREGADVIFACDIADYNDGSLRMFRKAGFIHYGARREPPGAKAGYRLDLFLTRERYGVDRRGWRR